VIGHWLKVMTRDVKGPVGIIFDIILFFVSRKFLPNFQDSKLPLIEKCGEYNEDFFGFHVI
jgi:hypothetical protein